MPTLPRELRELQYAGQPLTQRRHEILRHIAMGLSRLQLSRPGAPPRPGVGTRNPGAKTGCNARS